MIYKKFVQKRIFKIIKKYNLGVGCVVVNCRVFVQYVSDFMFNYIIRCGVSNLFLGGKGGVLEI